VKSNSNDYLLRPNEAQAWVWYQRAADAGEPFAWARLGERAIDTAFTATDPKTRDERMLESLRYYAAAAERARSEDWPEDAWRNWRYRRASLARVLEREGLMREVADAFAHIRKESSRSARQSGT
jgi:hypothetical protein